jgi:hypothetical protein
MGLSIERALVDINIKGPFVMLLQSFLPFTRFIFFISLSFLQSHTGYKLVLLLETGVYPNPTKIIFLYSKN